MTLQQKYDHYIQEYGIPPNYAEVDVKWSYSNEVEKNHIIKLSTEYNPKFEDSRILFYTEGLQGLQELTHQGTEDFTVLEDSINFFDLLTNTPNAYVHL